MQRMLIDGFRIEVDEFRKGLFEVRLNSGSDRFAVGTLESLAEGVKVFCGIEELGIAPDVFKGAEEAAKVWLAS